MKFIYAPAFLKNYKELSAELREQLDKQLAFLAIDPHHPSLRIHKRRGEKDIWQARITQSYRLFFRMQGDTIILLAVGPHEK